MALPLYLAMTAAEIRVNSPLPDRLAYMACHFSPYGTGLSNLPGSLPEGAMLILNDRTPICGHDPGRIVRQLADAAVQHKCSCILLDFQRPNVDETAALAAQIADALPCPVAISDLYANGLACPVLLPPVPPDVPLPEYIAPWEGREIWLEAALGGSFITLTAQGAACTPLPCPGQKNGHAEESLHCHYTIKAEENAAEFLLYRTTEDLQALLESAEALGITRAVGLWQELGST